MENAQEIASAQFTQEIFNGKQNMCNPSDKSIDEHHKKRKRMHDTVEYIANLFWECTGRERNDPQQEEEISKEKSGHDLFTLHNVFFSSSYVIIRTLE